MIISSALAQAVPGDSALVRPLRMASLPEEFRLDGRLDETVWAKAPAVNEFSVVEPDTLAPPPLESTVRMFYTDRGLYVGFHGKQAADTLVARLSLDQSSVGILSLSPWILPVRAFSATGFPLPSGIRWRMVRSAGASVRNQWDGP